ARTSESIGARGGLATSQPPRAPRAAPPAPQCERLPLTAEPAPAAHAAPAARLLERRGQAHDGLHIPAGPWPLLPFLEGEFAADVLVAGDDVDDVIDQVPAGGQQADLVVEAEGAHVHVR